MRPFELYLPVSDQNGVLGENRDLESCNKTGAANDHDAILFWLRKYALQPTAAYKYRNEAERLLMWANFHKRKALSSLTVLDCLEYINVFLRDPQPRRIWVMERPFKRDDPHWRPFRGPLSYRSREIALTTLKNLFRSLTEVGYLGFNSFAEVRQAKQEMTETQSIGPSQTRTHRVQIERSLSWDEWCFVQRCLLRLPNNKPATHRIRFIVYFAYGTGLRRAELASACIGDISEKFAGAELGMITALNIRGRGGELRQIPLCPSLLNVLEDYLEFRGLGRNPERCPPDTPLIPALEDNRDKAMRKAEAKTLINEGGASGKGAVPPPKKEKPITPDKLYETIKRFFVNVARAASVEAPELSATFSVASTHWLRHTFGLHGVANGMALATARNFLGHKGLATTSIYTTQEFAQRYRELDRFLIESLGD